MQHERGPRKPKLQQSAGGNQLHTGSMPPGLQHMSITENKVSASGNSLPFPSSLFGPPHHFKTLSLPAPPPVSSPNAHLETIQPPMFHPPTLPPPPGLLHILMSAEKCQVISIC